MIISQMSNFYHPGMEFVYYAFFVAFIIADFFTKALAVSYFSKNAGRADLFL